MKILLCYPPVSEEYNKIRDSGLTPHLSILCIASHLETIFEDLSIRLLDGHHLSAEAIESVISSWQPDIIGYSVDFTNYNNAVRLCRFAKNISADIWNILGSNHATNMCEVILKNQPTVDFIGLGDGEISCEDLVSIKKGLLPKEKGRNLAYLDPADGTVIRTRQELMDLKQMRAVDYDLANLDPYFQIQRKVMGPSFRMLQFTSQRGCANKPLCVFCGRYTDGIRFRDPEVYAREVAEWTEKLELTEVWDRSDSFVQSVQWLKQFCGAIRKYTDRFSTGKTTFKTYARADQLVRKDVMDYLQELNFRMVFIGYEAGDDRILKNIGKHANLDIYRKATQNVLSSGMKIDGSFIVGLPGENHQSLANHISFVKELADMGLDKIRVNQLLVLPGTPLYAAILRTFPEYRQMDVVSQDVLQKKIFQTDLYDLREFHGDVVEFQNALSETASAMTGIILNQGGGAEGYGYGKNKNILAGRQIKSKQIPAAETCAQKKGSIS